MRNALLIVLLLIAHISFAEIINIPDDHESIQAGIDASEDGDTVLVQPGEYVENIAFGSKTILVGSLTITTGNPAYIDSTIIDGDSNGSSVVSMGDRNEREASTPTLSGFTLINGSTDYGGGIYINKAIPALRYLAIRNNSASRTGGGIYTTNIPYDSELVFNNLTLDNNSSEWIGGGLHCHARIRLITISNSIFSNNSAVHGGGFYVTGRELALSNVTMIDNSAGEFGGAGYCNELGIANIEDSEFTANSAGEQGGGLALNHCENVNFNQLLFSNNSSGYFGGAAYISGSNAQISNVTVSNNEAGEFCGGFVFNAGWDARITQSIFVNNGEAQIGCRAGGIDNDIEAEYSLIQEGEDGVEQNDSGDLDWLEGNIDGNPLFVNAEEGDYHLTENSPCIDAGDPESDPDPDGTRADLGMFPFFQGTLVVDGLVLDFATEEPIEGAVVTSSDGTISYSDHEGYWSLSPDRLELFDLQVSAIGYLDSVVQDIELVLNDTLSMTFSLFHGELEPSIENIAAEITQGEEELFSFEISNPGNGILDWTVETRYRGDAGREPWELRQSYPFSEQLEDSRLFGVAYIDSLYYIAGANNGNPVIYVVNSDGDLINTYAQPVDHRHGMKDLACDGELIWGTIDDSVYGMTLEGEVATSFAAPVNSSTVITWDSDREVLWVGRVISNLIGIDREGNQLEGMEVERDGLRIYGLAYFQEDPDDSPLYILHREIDTDRQMVSKHNFETNEKMFVTYLDPEAGGIPQGAFVTDQFDNYSWVFMSVANPGAEDRVDIWQLAADTRWSIINPVAGMLNPAADQELTLVLDASDLGMTNYPAQLTFSHNGFGLETVIPLDLSVVHPDNVSGEKNLQLYQYAISSTYPNPFNSMVRINFTVPKMSMVSIKLYDLKGSLVQEIIHDHHITGIHSTIWDASTSPSGIYFVRMEAGGFSQTAKLMLLK